MDPERFDVRGDPRQAEKLIDELGLSTAEGTRDVKSLGVPSMKVTSVQVQSDKLLPLEKVSHFRGLAARANYIAADRPDIQFAAKEICRWMQYPTELGLSALKRLARYLIGRPRLVYQFDWQEACGVDVFSDTDWAGCVRTRKSTSGGCLMVGGHLLKSWSSTQPSQSLSSGEAEMIGVTKGAAAALGFKSLLMDLGISWPLRVWTDSSASIGMCTRQGIGKIRHMNTQIMWIQQRVRNGDLDLYKVSGEENPADILTKAEIPRERMEKLLEKLNCRFEEGRAASAPRLRAEGGKKFFAALPGSGGLPRQRVPKRGPAQRTRSGTGGPCNEPTEAIRDCASGLVPGGPGRVSPRRSSFNYAAGSWGPTHRVGCQPH